MRLLLLFFFTLTTAILSAEPQLIILRDNNDWNPMEWERDGEFYGLHMDIIKEACRIAGIEPVLRSLPWSRALYMMEAGDADAISGAVYSDERNEYLLFDSRNVLSRTNYFVVVRKDQPMDWDGSLETLAGLSVGVVKDFFYGEKYSRFRNDLDIHLFKSYELLIKNLEAGRIDAALSSENEYFSSSFPSTSDRSALTILEPYYEVVNNYLAFSRNRLSDDEFNRISDAMERFKKSQAYFDLLVKYGLER